MKLLVLNGPNLNLLGLREPHIYGSLSFEAYLNQLRNEFPNIEFSYTQSNHEGDLIDALHQAEGLQHQGVILNAGALTHSSIALGDAVKAISVPVIEVHISNTFSREAFRHQSYISAGAKGVILGFGMQGYALAVRSLI